MADRPAEGVASSFCRPQQPTTTRRSRIVAITKAEEVYTKTEALVEGGMSKADAFKQLASEYGQPVNSIRGSYYAHTSGKGGGKGRPRKRETTTEDALADARASLESSIENVDKEVETAKARADEARAEYDALKASADERKKAISERLELLK
jgi:hypothetical protein